MKEPHEKGLAIRSAPSFALVAVRPPMKRKQGERWAGYPASKICNQGADAVHHGGRPHDQQRQRERLVSPAQSKTPRTSTNSMHENREASRLAVRSQNERIVRWVKARAVRPTCTILRSRTPP